MIIIICLIYFFSHSLTAVQSLKKLGFDYTEIVASYYVDGDEVFFLKNDSYFASHVIEKNGLFYNNNIGVGGHHTLENYSNLRASFWIGYDERTEISTAIVVAWNDVDNVEYNGNFLDKTEYDDYTLFYGYSLEYTFDHPILYDENLVVIDYFMD